MLCRWRAAARVGIAIALVATCSAAATKRAAPGQLWSEIVAAKGGRERLAAIRSLAVFEAPADRKHPASTGTWLFAFPNSYFRWISDPSDSDPDPVAIIVRADANYRQSSRNGKVSQERLPTYAKHLLMYYELLFVAESADFKPQPLSVRTERDRGLYEVVTVEIDGVRADVYVRGGNRLPVRVMLPAAEESKLDTGARYDTYLDDYADYDGIQLPRSVSRVFDKLKTRVSWRVDYEVNPRYTQGFFNRSPNPNLGPEPWNK